MTNLVLSRDLELPLDAVTRTFGIVGQRGKGKTTAAVDLVEEIAKAGARCVVADPTGVWWGLSRPGSGDGLPAIILGGEHADVPLEETAGQLVADLVAHADYRVVVLDLKLLRKAQQVRFMADFSEALYHHNREPLHVVIDEADRFIPQSPREAGHLPRLMGAVEDIVKLGRSRGLGASLVTQRPATLNKNVLEQVETLIAFALVGPRDRRAIHEWIEAQGDTALEHEVMSTIAKLPRGEAWVWSPGFLGLLRRVQFRRRDTYDSSATPEVGAKRRAPKPRVAVDLDALRHSMASVLERVEQDDPVRLRRRIAQLEREAAQPAAPRPVETVVERVEVPVFDEAVFDRLYGEARDVRAGLERMERALDGLVDELGRRGVRFSEASDRRFTPPTRSRATPPTAVPEAHASAPSSARPADVGGDMRLRAGERKMLGVLAAHAPRRLTRIQLATLSGFSPRGGTFGTYLGTLKRGQLVDETSDGLAPTAAGDAIAEPRPPMTTDELLAAWHTSLRAGERRMLDELVAAWPEHLTRDDLGERTGFTTSGGTFGTYLGTLRRNGLVDVDGTDVRASDTLFLDQTGRPA